MSRLEEVESGLDKTEMGYYPYRDLAEVARALAAEVDELRAKLEQVRSEVGCARGQRTTQYCAEAVEYKRRLDAVVVGKPETDIAKAIDGTLYLVMFANLFGGIPETLHFRSISDGEWFWSKYPPNEGGPLYGKSNTVLWFAEIRAVAIAEGRDNA